MNKKYGFFSRVENVKKDKEYIDSDIIKPKVNYLESIGEDNESVAAVVSPENNIVYVPRLNRKSYGTVLSNNYQNMSQQMLGLIDLIYANPQLANSIKITSSYRPGARTTSGVASYHSSGNAIDIVPLNGNFKQLQANLMSDPDIVSYMKQNGIGILDETDPNMMKRTGATGAHFHIGPDSIAVKQFNNLMSTYGYNS